MLDIIDRLKKGDREIADCFAAAEKKWSTISNISAMNVKTLAELLQSIQNDFESLCKNRNLGKSIMAWSAFAHIYTPSGGFGNNQKCAENLAQAFEASNCSFEVKSEAKDAARLYGL